MRSFISSSKIRTALWKFRTVAVFGVPFLASLEVATRIEQAIRYGAPLLGSYTHRSALHEHDEFGVKGKPHGVYEKWVLNEFGLRGPEIGRDKPPGTLRVVSIGASETLGMYETPGLEWPRQLERRLRASASNVQVLNASLDGLTLRQRVEFFNRRILPLMPDLGILMLEYPSYVGVVRAAERDSMQERRASGPTRAAGRAIDLKPRVLLKTKDAVLPRLPARVRQVIQDLLIRARVARIRSGLGDDFARYRKVREAELRAFEQDLVGFFQRADEESVRIILLIPAVWVTDATLREHSANFPYLHADWIREARRVFPEVARRFSAERGIPTLDIATVVEGREAELMMDMFHFNDVGADVVAEAVAREVETWIADRQESMSDHHSRLR